MGCPTCNSLTLLRGNGIKTITDNGDGTLTITLDNGATFTTSDLTGPTGPTGPAGANGSNGTNGTNGIDGVNGTTLISRSDTESVGPVSLVPVTITSTDFPQNDDGIELSFILYTTGTSTGNIRIPINGGASNLIDRALVAAKTSNLVTAYLYRSGNDLEGHAIIQPFEDGLDNGGLVTISSVGFFLAASNTITAQLTGNNATIGKLTVKKILK